MTLKFDFQRDEVSFFFSLSHLSALSCVCSTTLSVDELLAMGGEDTPVALAHSMGTARLTVGGEDHSELLK